jgi:hypothetical protein
VAENSGLGLGEYGPVNKRVKLLPDDPEHPLVVYEKNGSEVIETPKTDRTQGFSWQGEEFMLV